MNKAELIEAIADKANVTKVEVNAVLNSLVKTISESLKAEEKVTLVGFGVFSVKKFSSRTARNPRTGEAIAIDEKRVARFKAGKQLVEDLNLDNKTIKKTLIKT